MNEQEDEVRWFITRSSLIFLHNNCVQRWKGDQAKSWDFLKIFFLRSMVQGPSLTAWDCMQGDRLFRQNGVSKTLASSGQEGKEDFRGQQPLWQRRSCPAHPFRNNPHSHTALFKPSSNPSSGGWCMIFTSAACSTHSSANKSRFWSFPLIVHTREGLPMSFPLCPSSAAFLTVLRFPLLAPLLLFGKILWDFYDFMSYLVQLFHHLISLPLFFFKWFIFIKSFQGIPLGTHKNNSLCMFIFHWFMWHVIKLCNYKSTYNRHK